MIYLSQHFASQRAITAFSRTACAEIFGQICGGVLHLKTLKACYRKSHQGGEGWAGGISRYIYDVSLYV